MEASDEQFTFAIPIIFFQSIYFRDVSLKNYLILYVKQNKSMSASQTVSRFDGLGDTALSTLPLSTSPPPGASYLLLFVPHCLKVKV